MRDSLITKELLKLKIPTVLVIHNSSSPRNLPVIRTNCRLIAKMASEHLIEKGYKNLAFCGFDYYDWSNKRKKYFSYYNKISGCRSYIYSQRKKECTQDWEKEQRHVSEWIKKLPKPVGIFTCNDDRGQHILEVCKLNSFKVPEDVAVIGVDNDPMICDIGDPPLTSIALNAEYAGYKAAELLLRLINGKKMHGQQIVVAPAYIVQRQSSDILAVKDKEVASAMRFIRKNARNKILVGDVVKATGVSRRSLELRFRKMINRSIYDEIRKVRVEWISKLLLETDMPISQITSHFSFTDVEHIARYFKKEKGIGLYQFRKLHQLQ